MFTLARNVKRVALLVVGILFIVAFTPGAALASFGDCPGGTNDNTVCFFDGINGEPPITYYWMYVPGGITTGQCINLSGFNDLASSVYNHSKYRLMAYTNSNCSGAYVLTNPHVARNFVSPYNDTISSFVMLAAQ